MQRVSLFGRIVNISLLGEKAVLRRNVFTMEGPEKGNGVPFSSIGNREHDEKLLQPLAHILQVPGQHIRPRVAEAYNYWLKVPADKLVVLKDIFHMLRYSITLIDDIQDNRILRRGIPVAHSIYGVASTINAGNYLLLKGLKRVQSLNHRDAIRVCIEQQLKMYYGQGLDIYWRDNYTCPSIEEYKLMATQKASLFMTEMAVMQVLSDNKTDFTKLNNILALYIQIRDDYCNLCLQQYTMERGYCEDITEGKFSFPIIHAIMSHPDDHQVLCILRQRTRDVELKKYCVTLLEKFGSFSYTRQTLEELDAEARAEVAKLGGNPLLEDLLDKLLDWKRDIGEKNPAQ